MEPNTVGYSSPSRDESEIRRTVSTSSDGDMVLVPSAPLPDESSESPIVDGDETASSPVELREKELSYFWLSAPFPVVPESMKALNQAVHLAEPLITVLAFQVVKNRMLGVVSFLKTLAFIQRTRTKKNENLWTFGTMLLSLFAHKFLVKRKSMLRSPLSAVAAFITPLQYVSWSLCNLQSINGVAVRAAMMGSMSFVFELLCRYTKKDKIIPFPTTGKEVTKRYVYNALVAKGILNTNHAEVTKVETTTLSGKKGDGGASEQQGFIGEVNRVNIQYSGEGDDYQHQLPRSLVIKFASNSPKMRFQLRLVNVYLREAFFYQKIAPRLEQWNDSNHEAKIVMLPKVYHVDYNDSLAISTILLEDAAPLKPGDETEGASWQQACSVALRYARFHAIHWCDSLRELDKTHPELSLYRSYDWMDLNEIVMDNLLRKSLQGMMSEEDLHDMVDPGMQRTFTTLINNFDIYLMHQKSGPMTFIHADARMENMLWPDLTKINQTPRMKYRHDLLVKPGMDFDDQYERLGTRWLSVDWQTSTKGKGVYDLAYFVAMDLEVSEEYNRRDIPDKILVRAYHDELLRNCQRARAAQYSYEQCWHDYQMSMLMAILIPLAVMRPESIGGDGILRAKAVRRSMLGRCIKAIRRVGADDLLCKFVNNARKHKSLSSKISPLDDAEGLEGARIPSPRDEIMLANLEPSQLEEKNSYDRWFLNGYSPDGSVFFAAAMGMYPGRDVVDASFSVSVAGIQHNVRCSRKFSKQRDLENNNSDDNQDCFFEASVGPIRIIVREPLSCVELQVDLPNENIRAEVTFTGRFPPHLEPHYSMNVTGAGKMEYDRLTQLVAWDGYINVGGNHNIQVASWYGCRDRSWGIRPHPTADKAPASNLRRNKLLGNKDIRWVLNQVIPPSMAQFYWFWCPLNFEKCAMVYHTQQNPDGKPVNRAASILGEIPAPASNQMDSSQRVSVDAEYHVLKQNREGNNKPSYVRDPKVAAAGHSLVYKPFSRHAKTGSIFMTLEDGRTIKIKFEPLYPFFMSGVGYGHPVFGHGTCHPDAEVSVQYDKFDVELADRQNPLYWHIQEICRISAYFPNDDIPFEEGIGAVEQLSVGPHAPSKFSLLCDT